jgi:excisionase family DNA binding protein
MSVRLVFSRKPLTAKHFGLSAFLDSPTQFAFGIVLFMRRTIRRQCCRRPYRNNSKPKGIEMNVLALTPERASGRKLGDVNTVAEKCDCSPRHVYRLADAGRMPAPRKLGALVRWDLEEIDRWIAEGCRPIRQGKGGSR